MTKVKALVTPKVLVWAREQSGYDLAEVAVRLKKTIEDISAWEAGSDLPSIAQARALAELYRRPLAVFYMPEPPEEFHTLRDYRRVKDAEARALSVELIDVIRTVQYHQTWVRDFLANEGEEPLRFIGTANLSSSVSAIANSIRKELGVDVNWQLNCKAGQESMNYWLAKIEQNRIFVVRKGGIDPAECRGFAVADDMAPFIFINTDDALSAQLFTIMHELSHLWINQSGISNMEVSGTFISKQTSSIEKLCNMVASDVLMPAQSFIESLAKFDQGEEIEKIVEKLSKTFHTSEEAVARRLLDLGRISQQIYDQLRAFYIKRWLEFRQGKIKKQKEQDGGPSYYTTSISFNGLAYTQMIVGAYTGGRITGRDASSLLNVKINNFNKLSGKANELYSSRLNAIA